jgi:hypothetical protein
VKAARLAASQRLTEDDVIEAVGSVEGTAVEALIVERGDPFVVDADLLVRLDDAGVPDGVIDLMVAVSYPDRFAVKSGAMPIDELEEADEFAPRRRFYMAGGYYNPFWSGFGFYPRYYGLGFYDYYGYGYGGYGLGSWGYGGYGYYPRAIVVTPRSDTGLRMIKGRQGYTRGGGGSGYTGRRTTPTGGSSARSGSSSVTGRSGSSGGAVRRTKPGGGGSSGVTSKPSSSTRSSAVRRTVPRGGGLI